jgi:hypothetical protein
MIDLDCGNCKHWDRQPKEPPCNSCQKYDKYESGILDFIFDEVREERKRQDIDHPKLPKYFLHPRLDPDLERLEKDLIGVKDNNDRLEDIGEHSWCGIILEEHLEALTSITLEELREEYIQNIAVGVRIVQAIDEGKVTL